MIAGMRPFGFNDTNAGSFDSLFEMSIKWGSYGRPVSSSIIETLTPLGVGAAYSCKRSG
jgi:hypothetical protein